MVTFNKTGSGWEVKFEAMFTYCVRFHILIGHITKIPGDKWGYHPATTRVILADNVMEDILKFLRNKNQ